MFNKKSKRSRRKRKFDRKFVTVMSIFLLAVAFALILPFTSDFGPMVLDVVEIVDSSCGVCLNISSISEGFLSQDDVELGSKRVVEYDSDEGQMLLKEHNISSVPALVVSSSRLDELPSKEILRLEGSTGVFDRSAPYVDVSTGSVMGVVEIVHLGSTCGVDCPKGDQVDIQLAGMGVSIGSVRDVEELSVEGQELIDSLNLDFSPAVMVSRDIEAYWWVFPQISDAFLLRGDWYVFRSPVPPYKDLSDNEVKGKVTVTYVLDDTCTDCFKPELLTRSFADFGMFVYKESNVSANNAQGQALIRKYNITQVPTVIYSKDIKMYVPLQDSLEALGSYASIDGSFVVRNHDSLQAKYRTL